MNYIEQIAIGSPWWADRAWHENDRHLLSAENSRIKFRHLREAFKIMPSSIDIIRGPRQIGKTTELKFIVRELSAGKANPKSIGYFVCDIISKHKELFEVLKSFHQHLKVNGIKKGVFILDETTSVKDWYKAVKGFVDLGLSKNIHLILTGSSSIELERGHDRMPGRRNGGKDYLFLPMCFSDFCSRTNPQKTPLAGNFKRIIQSKNSFEKFREDALIDAAYYKHNISLYFKTGGFPKAVSDFVARRKISDDTLLIYQSVLFSEFEKYKKNIIVLMQIMGEILKNISTPVSFNAIMRNVELASANTVKEYVEMLNMAFLGLEVLCVDIQKKKPFHKKDKKLYFIDPVVFGILSEKFHLSYPADEKMAENLSAVHISRLFLADWAALGVLNKLFYWKSKKGNEVDFVVFPDKKPFGFEVKYQDTISKWDEMSVKKGIGRGLLITKDAFEYGEIPKIPLWAFLLLKMNE